MTVHARPTAGELQAVAVLPPEVLGRYLSGTGWQPGERLERATLWTRREDDGEFEILLPADRAVRDYPGRMADLLTTVAAVEDRPIPLIVDDLQASGSDTVAFRLLPGGPSGTIPLFNAVDALAGVRELLVASTYALMVDTPMLVQGRRPERAFEFARTVRLGSPRAGSWSIAARLPVGEPGGDAEAPLGRRVSVQLHRTVRACFAASGEALSDFDPELFLRRTGEGVSANACAALTQLGRDGVPFDIRFGWTPQLRSSLPTRSFRFRPGQIEVLRMAAEHLRVVVPDGQITVEGQVSRLRRDTGEGGQATVRGPIRTVYGASDRSVRVLLPDDLYRVVVEAHGRRRQVRVTGTAVRGRIERVARVEVLERPSPG
ncbi:hypothetical protein [Spirilliplanes yamanashiensis]|uniref:Uncharacterized protein n=1 Tax=Spirilliplanes yamanashiensis TaxID=42233 RepID=A0A8J3Y8D9_9ACTN|nr:hypothetical protein [Spirilliplanes yamanashiensis]MDP9817201.1 hypothetical protein [Spirilliplanes yamanashiensis]GIJ03145.1 hypothetical protein Sya03_24970 [Spirilliplanes yamanashiensis]